MNADTVGQIRELAADILGVDPGTLHDSAGPENIPNWDSVNHLNIVLAIEQAFGIELDPEDIEQMQSIGAMVAVVDRKRTAAAG